MWLTMRRVFDTKKDGKPVVPNIARLVEPFRAYSDGHHTIAPDEIGKFIDHHGQKSKAVLALSLLMQTGFRVSDLAVIGPQHRCGDILKLRLFKNRNRTPVDIEIAIHPILEAVMELHPVTGLTNVRTEFDKAFTVKGLGNRVSAWFSQARGWQLIRRTTKPPTICWKRCSAGRTGRHPRSTRATQTMRGWPDRPYRRSTVMGWARIARKQGRDGGVK
ncbi:hypothetical protein LJR098_002579 [Rhizobium sp. LjRoot98]|uniref:hypothetical protein n=1 Tax=Rhizobium sp. LjRoot98 TaxID=3342345 RepID=UPI003ECF7068